MKINALVEPKLVIREIWMTPAEYLSDREARAELAIQGYRVLGKDARGRYKVEVM